MKAIDILRRVTKPLTEHDVELMVARRYSGYRENVSNEVEVSLAQVAVGRGTRGTPKPEARPKKRNLGATLKVRSMQRSAKQVKDKKFGFGQ